MQTGVRATTNSIVLGDGTNTLTFAVRSNTWGTTDNGLAINFTNNAGASTTATYNSAGNGTLTFNLGLTAGAITNADLQTALTNMAGGSAAAFAARYTLIQTSETGALNGANMTASVPLRTVRRLRLPSAPIRS